MPSWKSSNAIFGSTVDDHWLANPHEAVVPPSFPWNESRPPRVDEVDVWEVITEMSGPVGVYAAWQPHAELYIVTRGLTIVAEFSGWMANTRLEKYLQENGIPYPKGLDGPIEVFKSQKLIIPIGA